MDPVATTPQKETQMLDQRSHENVTVRPAEATDEAALTQLEELDGRSLGAAPLLVAECDGAIVAALSLTDGSVVADPFRFTVEAVGQLRDQAAPNGCGTAACARRKALRRVAGGTVAAALLVLVL